MSNNEMDTFESPRPAAPHWHRHIPLCLFLFALFVRVGYWVDISHHVTHGYTEFHWLGGAPVSDASSWIIFGDAIQRGCSANHDWVARRPLYGYFLASLYSVTDAHLLVAQWANMLMSAASVVFLYSIGRRLFGIMPGLGTALWFCFDPYSLQLSITPLSETMGSFFTVWHVWLLIRGTEGGRRNLVGAGLTFAAANLTRTLSLFALPMEVLLIWLVCGKRDWSIVKGFKAAVVFGASATLLLLVGMLRNWWMVGIFTISDNTASILYAATSPEYGAWSPDVEHEVDGLGLDTHKQRYDYFMKKAVDNLKTHPWPYIARVQTLAWAVISQSMISPWFYWPQYAFIGILGAVGLSRLRRASARGSSTAGIIVFSIFVMAVITFLFLGLDMRGRYLVWALAALSLCRSILRVDSGLYVANLWFWSVLGVAAFGVYDTRFNLMFDWLLAIGVFGGLRVLLDLFELISFARWPMAKKESSDDDRSVVIHRFLVATAGIILVLGLTGIQTTCHPLPPLPLISEQQFGAVVQKMASMSPDLPPSIKTKIDELLQSMTVPDKGAVGGSAIAKASQYSPGNLVVVIGRIEAGPCRLPAKATFKNFYSSAKTRFYDRTVIRFLGHYPDGKGCMGWATFDGFVPASYFERDFCFVAVPDENHPGEYSDFLEAVAIFPLSETNELQIDKGLFANTSLHKDNLERLSKLASQKDSTTSSNK